MSKIVINEKFCPKNHYCPTVHICPVGAINQDNAFSAPNIDESLCIGCGKCVKSCMVFQTVKG